jgi:hypothetical protein
VVDIKEDKYMIAKIGMPYEEEVVKDKELVEYTIKYIVTKPFDDVTSRETLWKAISPTLIIENWTEWPDPKKPGRKAKKDEDVGRQTGYDTNINKREKSKPRGEASKLTPKAGKGVTRGY